MTRPERDRTLTGPDLTVVPDDRPVVVGEAVDEPVDEPREYGVRVVWQSEDQRLEAAEFLLATRVQEQVRRRVARAAMDVRDHRAEELSTAIHQRPAD